MKPAIITCALVVAVLSCTYNDETPKPDTTPAAREILYNWDGALLGVNTLTHDANNNVTHEYFKTESESRTDLEKTYEYDAQNRLIRQTAGTPGQPYFVTEFAYANNLLASKTELYSGQSGVRTVYYYTGTRIDSAMIYTYPEGALLGNGAAIIYRYDDKQRLVQEGASKWYQYDEDDRRVSTCDGDPDAGLAINCFVNEYNSVGQLTRVYQVDFPSGQRYLSQEYYYKNGRLQQKWDYNWWYLMGPTAPDILKTTYEY